MTTESSWCFWNRNRLPEHRTGPRLFAMAVITLLAFGAINFNAPSAWAVTGSGGRSSVTPTGDIVTTVLFGTRRTTPGRRRSSPATPLRCRWTAVSDGTLEWLIAIGSNARGRVSAAGRVVDLINAAGPEALTSNQLQSELCNGRATGRFRLVAFPRTSAQQLTRTMVTRLPLPNPAFSPPAPKPVPVGEPVFVSFPANRWQAVNGILSVGTLRAEVIAHPVSFRVVSGDPQGATATCTGRGMPFNATDSRSSRVQAQLPGRCSVTYFVPTGKSGRPGQWIGTVTVLWAAKWRLGDGPWRSLGLIPRTKVTTRQVSEVSTAIESTVK